MEECLTAQMTPEEKILKLNRESIQYLERNHCFLDLFQRVEIFRGGEGSEMFQETRARLDRIFAAVLRELSREAPTSADEIELMVLAMTGMMKEIVHNLPRPWPADLAERVTELFLHGVRSSAEITVRTRGRAVGRGAK